MIDGKQIGRLIADIGDSQPVRQGVQHGQHAFRLRLRPSKKGLFAFP